MIIEIGKVFLPCLFFQEGNFRKIIFLNDNKTYLSGKISVFAKKTLKFRMIYF